MSQRRYHIVLNANSGTVQALGLESDALKEMFSRFGHEVTIDAEKEEPLSERIARALASDADTIVAAGGDGTVTALAGALVDSDKTLAILPLGTANMLARDLKVPLEIEQWLEILDKMEPQRIDVAEVNGRIFLHKVVIGLIPQLAAGREHIRGEEGIAPKLGLLRFFVRRIARAKRIALEVTLDDGQPRIERVQALAVASNEYDEGVGRFFSRTQLDRGFLSLYAVRHLNLRDMIRLAAEMVAGHWRDDEALDIRRATRVTIRAKKPKVQTMFDGEIEMLDVPLNFTIRPLALKILVPAPVGDLPATDPVDTEV